MVDVTRDDDPDAIIIDTTLLDFDPIPNTPPPRPIESAPSSQPRNDSKQRRRDLIADKKRERSGKPPPYFRRRR